MNAIQIREAADEILLDHARGAASAPVQLIVETHVALNPAARRRHRCLEAVGGAMLDTIEPVATAPGALDRLFARIDAGHGTEAPAARDDAGRFPAVLRAHMPGGIDALAWRQVARGVHEAALGVEDGPRKASLLRIAAGRAIPRHTHRGDEMTLVLEGDFTDEHGRYARGDLAVADGSVEHQPVAGTGGDCLCLVVTSAPIRLTGKLLRLLNPFLPR
ncbi:MAG: ChrR family anti-sigma-E factor [Alphaproteobacteria bacterium]